HGLRPQQHPQHGADRFLLGFGELVAELAGHAPPRWRKCSARGGMSGAGRSLAPYHQVLAQVYKYDQLNRLKQAQGVEGLTAAANSWEGVTDAVADRYKSAYTYDANGNILTAERHDETGQQYDDFAYQYHDPGGLLAQNRLYDLYDAATHTTGADIVAPAGTFDNSTTGVNQKNN